MSLRAFEWQSAQFRALASLLWWRWMPHQDGRPRLRRHVCHRSPEIGARQSGARRLLLDSPVLPELRAAPRPPVGRAPGPGVCERQARGPVAAARDPRRVRAQLWTLCKRESCLHSEQWRVLRWARCRSCRMRARLERRRQQVIPWPLHGGRAPRAAAPPALRCDVYGPLRRGTGPARLVQGGLQRPGRPARGERPRAETRAAP
mmetsp:Transcript_67526/g.154846  ORF Transcript_67526/g.154846 Transcript_67526/m.154846 type:complete len:204 (-) Transcript_67526:854-1465(-)